MEYDFSCPKCSGRLLVKDWRKPYLTGESEPWCFCSVCRYRMFAKRTNQNFNKDQVVGEMTWKYIDRMSDPTPEDPAEKILAEFVDEWHKIWFGDE